MHFTLTKESLTFFTLTNRIEADLNQLFYIYAISFAKKAFESMIYLKNINKKLKKTKPNNAFLAGETAN